MSWPVQNAADYRRLSAETTDFKAFLTSGPVFDDLELSRSAELPRVVDLTHEA